MSQRVPSLSVFELKALMDSGAPLVVLDVREPEERVIAVLKDNVHIPLMQLTERVSECKRLSQSGQPFIVYCRSGARSASAVEFLINSGLNNAKNLDGGILAWSEHIDPSLPKY